MNSVEWSLATRFLLSRRRERFLSVASVVAILGMAFGVGSLLVALSVISGFQREYKKAILGFNSHLILMSGDEIGEPAEVAEKVFRSVSPPAIKGWTPFIYREGMAVSGAKVKGIVLKGVDFGKYSNLSRMRINLWEEGSPSNPDRLPSVLLGKDLAATLAPKDRIIRILFPQGPRPERGNVRRFFVTGTFESGLYEYDSSFAFLSLPEAERFFQTGGRVSGLEIWLDDPDKAESWAEALRRDFDFPYVIMTWRELNEGVFRALEVEKAVFSLLMTVLIAVASLNTLGTLMMLIIEKRREVAILRAQGLSWRRLRKLFLFDGLLIGFLGVALGVIVGLGALFFIERWQPIRLEAEIYFVSQVPVAYLWGNFFWVVASAFLVVFLGCELALRGISKMNILRTLVEG